MGGAQRCGQEYDHNHYNNHIYRHGSGIYKKHIKTRCNIKGKEKKIEKIDHSAHSRNL